MELGMGIVVALRVLWSVAIGATLLGFLSLGTVSEFVRDLSRRGKLKLATSSDNPPRFSVPQRWFAHFYVLGCLVNTLLLVITFLFAYSCTFPMQSHESQVSAFVAQMGGSGTRDSSGGIGNVGHFASYKGRAWGSCVVLAMLELQLLRRVFESLHVFHYSPLARMHIFGYLAGLGSLSGTYSFKEIFKAEGPRHHGSKKTDREFFSLFCAFVVKRLGRAWILHTGPPLFNFQLGLKDYAMNFKGLGPFQWVGLSVFLWGWIQQHRLHSILASLRAKKVLTGVEAVLTPSSVDKKRADRYEIPHGSWFEWVSGAHYLAEIVLYAGIVIASDGRNLNIWLLFFWVVLNLTLAARETHGWYKSKFEDYPPLRRAILPFIY